MNITYCYGTRLDPPADVVIKVAAILDRELGEDHESLSIGMGCFQHAKKWRAEAMRKAAEAVLAA